MLNAIYLLLVLIVEVLAIPHPASLVERNDICSSFPYIIFQPLSNYPAAMNFCSSKYPITTTSTIYATSTSTSTINSLTTTTTTSTSVATTTSTSISTFTTSTFTSTTTTTTTTYTETTYDLPPHKRSVAIPAPAIATLLSSLQSLASNALSTACSCIENPVVSLVRLYLL